MTSVWANLVKAYWNCKHGNHDAYLTRCLLGYDYKCRNCRMVRYRDRPEPEWAEFDLTRGVDLYQNDIVAMVEREEGRKVQIDGLPISSISL